MSTQDNIVVPDATTITSIYQGCGGWDEFRGLFPGTALETMPEPDRVVSVNVERRDTGLHPDTNGSATWHDGQAYWYMNGRHVHGEMECRYIEMEMMSEEESLHHLLQCMRPCNVQADAPNSTSHTWQEAVSLASLLGISIVWAVECLTGDRYDSDRRVVVIYDNEQMALRHVRAAEMYEQAMPVDDEWDGPSGWFVNYILKRNDLPPELVGYDEGSLSAPPFPTRMETTIVEDAERPWMAPERWTVDVPGRGGVTFTGQSSSLLSARFLCTLPGARPTPYDRSKANDADWSMRGMMPVMGGESIVHWNDLDSMSMGSIASEGADASALLVDAFNLALVCSSRRWE